MATIAALLAAAALSIHAQNGPSDDSSVRINQIQVIGTHNSYHSGYLPGIAKVLQQQDPESFRENEYSHPDLAVQLDHGIRQIELDIVSDSKGGRYAHPSGPSFVAKAGLPPDPDPYPHGEMLRPGFKVIHWLDMDYASNCQPFTACLTIVRNWSRSHPSHLPIFILVETKFDEPNPKFPGTHPEPYTAATFDALDAEILSVFRKDEIVTPDQVRGKYATLEKAVLHRGWPTLAEARGKVIFLLDQPWNTPLYLRGHPGLRGRVLFTNSNPGRDDAAFVERNDGSATEIAALVRKGYLVRVRSDSDTQQARSNDTRRRDEALRSGAQMVSTDYPWYEPAKWTGYYVALPGNAPARCNPVASTAACKDDQLEPPTIR